MKVAYRLFAGAGVGFWILFGFYWFSGYEPAGRTLLLLCGPACFLVGGYLWLQLRKHGELAEDVAGAGPGDGAGPVVSVPAPSLWPLGVAFGAGTFAAGLVLGPWLAAPGAIVLIVSVVGVALKGRNY